MLVFQLLSRATSIIKKILHLQGSRGQKVAKETPFFQGANFRPTKILKMRCQIFYFSYLVAYCLKFLKNKFKFCGPIFQLPVLILLKKNMSKKAHFCLFVLEITTFSQQRVIVSLLINSNVF